MNRAPDVLPPGHTAVARSRAAAGRPGPGDGAGSVALRRVTKKFGTFTAIDDLDLEVRGGEFLAILGPSGSGKTTLLRMIGGFVSPTAGTIEISGTSVGHLPPYRRDVNTVFQNYALFPHMTVEANVAYGLRMKRVPRAERKRRAAEMLELVQLTEFAAHRPAELSGGMQQRVALARALVNRPSVLLLDEPLGALDRKLRETMQLELRRIQVAVGTTFIYITHDQLEALSLSDRLAVMRAGRIEQLGSPGEVYDQPASLWVADFVGDSSQIHGVLRQAGKPARVETDHAEILADHLHGDLPAAARVTALVRPDDVTVLTSAPADPGANCVKADVTEVLNLGGTLRVVGTTAGGTELMARVSRTSAAAGPAGAGLGPGVAAWFTWPSSAVHLYPAPHQPADLQNSQEAPQGDHSKGRNDREKS
jgi:spermidine/putrescine transport system ATP-binding protein